MDVGQVASQLGLEKDDVYDVLELFIHTAPSDLMKMTTGYKIQDTAQIGAAAHSLRGSTSALGFMDISNHAQLIMKQSRDKKNEDLTQSVPLFLNQMRDLLLELEEVLNNR
jgi:HPt (histidine-containing phosphotransfer) domain-containing protein